MRRIALLVSLLLAIACESNDAPSRGGEIPIVRLWNMATESVVKIKGDYTIRGYVVANDKLAEVEHCIVVADDTAGVEVAIDARDVDIMIPLYSEVSVRCTGLVVRRLGGKLLLGLESDGEYVVNRLPEEELYNRITVDTTQSVRISAKRRHVADLGSSDMLTYIRIDSLYYAEGNTCWTDVDPLTGKRATTIRYFEENDDTLRVVTNGDCRYATHKIPEGYLSLQGILDWYDGAYALRVTNHEIVPL